ncbi:MAG: hypothetical protein ACKO37_02870 [Vampirovibrionales bacterium]
MTLSSLNKMMVSLKQTRARLTTMTAKAERVLPTLKQDAKALSTQASKALGTPAKAVETAKEIQQTLQASKTRSSNVLAGVVSEKASAQRKVSQALKTLFTKAETPSAVKLASKTAPQAELQNARKQGTGASILKQVTRTATGDDSVMSDATREVSQAYGNFYSLGSGAQVRKAKGETTTFTALASARRIEQAKLQTSLPALRTALASKAPKKLEAGLELSQEAQEELTGTTLRTSGRLVARTLKVKTPSQLDAELVTLDEVAPDSRSLQRLKQTSLRRVAPLKEKLTEGSSDNSATLKKLATIEEGFSHRSSPTVIQKAQHGSVEETPTLSLASTKKQVSHGAALLTEEAQQPIAPLMTRGEDPKIPIATLNRLIPSSTEGTSSTERPIIIDTLASQRQAAMARTLQPLNPSTVSPTPQSPLTPLPSSTSPYPQANDLRSAFIHSSTPISATHTDNISGKSRFVPLGASPKVLAGTAATLGLAGVGTTGLVSQMGGTSLTPSSVASSAEENTQTFETATGSAPGVNVTSQGNTRETRRDIATSQDASPSRNTGSGRSDSGRSTRSLPQETGTPALASSIPVTSSNHSLRTPEAVITPSQVVPQNLANTLAPAISAVLPTQASQALLQQQPFGFNKKPEYTPVSSPATQFGSGTASGISRDKTGLGRGNSRDSLETYSGNVASTPSNYEGSAVLRSSLSSEQTPQTPSSIADQENSTHAIQLSASDIAAKKAEVAAQLSVMTGRNVSPDEISYAVDQQGTPSIQFGGKTLMANYDGKLSGLNSTHSIQSLDVSNKPQAQRNTTGFAQVLKQQVLQTQEATPAVLTGKSILTQKLPTPILFQSLQGKGMPMTQQLTAHSAKLTQQHSGTETNHASVKSASSSERSVASGSDKSEKASGKAS